jgi:hypothetical protein
MAAPLCTYEEAISRAAQIVADAWAHMATRTPEQAAEEAWTPGGPSKEELADKIRALREQKRLKTAA